MTAIALVDFNLSPEITLGDQEHHKLVSLALAGGGYDAADADWLLHELDRARLVPDDTVPPDVVRIGSTVRYRTRSGEERSVELVLPKDADIALDRISVLTPVGAALIGLRIGQSITWLARDGHKQVLTVLWVVPPSDGDDPGPIAA
jgi:regulator of nucleoside diphosphate kinase